MSSEVGFVPLRDLSVRITKGTTPTKGEGFAEEGVNYIKSESITSDGSIDASKFAFIDAETHDKLARSKLRAGNVLFSMAGVYLGKSAVVLPEHLPANTNQAVGIVTLDESKADPYFIHYSLQSPACRAWVLRSAAQSAQPNFNLQEIGDLKIPAFPLALQKEVAGVLRMLDDRITLLRETNATLEAIAQALFKSWFVDFDPVRAKAEGRARQDGERSGQPRMPQASDLPRPGAEAGAEAQGQPEGAIQGSMSAAEGRMPKAAMDAATAALFPDSFEESEHGLVPKGWERLAFTETVKVIGGGTPKTSVPEYWDGDIPWFSVVDAPAVTDVFVIDTVKHISVAGLNGSSTKLLPEGTTIISARGTVGRLALVGKDMAMNQSCYGLQGKAGDAYFTYFSTYRLVEALKQRSHGSVFDTITTETMKGVQVTYPDAGVIEAFEAVLGPFMLRIKENLQQAQTLTHLRDTLLPRLISGQLRLPEAQEQLEEALV